MSNTEKDIARMILNYLSRNHDAGDTLKGISRWWLNFERIDITVNEVSAVLETLIKEGKVKRQVTSGDSTIYKICKEA